MTRSAPVACMVALLLLAGCSGAQVAHDLGMNRDNPDEFEVTTRAPLAIPSDFSLPPPQPGAPRPQEPATEVSAEAVLDPSVELQNHAAAESAGQDALVAAAGPGAPADIRQTIEAERKQLNDTSGIGNTLAFWQKPPTPGKIVNASKEAARLQAIGIPILSAAPAAP